MVQPQASFGCGSHRTPALEPSGQVSSGIPGGAPHPLGQPWSFRWRSPSGPHRRFQGQGIRRRPLLRWRPFLSLRKRKKRLVGRFFISAL